MKPREREREDYGHDDVISDDGGCSSAPPPALRPPSDVMCKVFSQLDCDDVLVSCSLVCKQWYRDSSELRERRKTKYMATLAFICDRLPRNFVDSFYPSITNELKRRL